MGYNFLFDCRSIDSKMGCRIKDNLIRLEAENYRAKALKHPEMGSS